MKSRLFVGVEPNAGPQTEGTSKRCQRTPELDGNGQKNEGNLSYSESLQHGRH